MSDIIEIVVGPPRAEESKAIEAGDVTAQADIEEKKAEKAAQEPEDRSWECSECGYRTKLEGDQVAEDMKCPKCGPKREKRDKTDEKGEKSPQKSETVPQGEKSAQEPDLAPEQVKSDKTAPEADPAPEGQEMKNGPEVLHVVKTALDGLMERLKGLFGNTDAEQITAQFGNSAEGGVGQGFKTFTGEDGRAWLLTWTTNAFEDREGEIFSTKSIQDYVDRHADDPIKGEYWFWHIPGTKFADIVWQGVVGRFLVETGPFDDTPTGQAFKAFFAEFPGGHETVAPIGWGTSHGYVYRLPDRMDGVYEWFDKKETTVLPSHAASNPFTAMEVFEMALSTNQKAALEAIGGEELVAQVEARGAEMTKELEEAGVAFKGGDGDEGFVVVPVGGFAGQIAQVAAQVEDPGLAAELKQIAQALKAAPESESMDDDEDEDETEDDGEQPAKKPPKAKAPPKKEGDDEDDEEEDEEEAEKATWTTAYKNDLPDASFLFVQAGGEKDSEGRTEPRSYRHLPYRDKSGGVDLPHLRSAITRLSQKGTGESEQAGDWLTEETRTRLLAKARAALAEHSKELVDLDSLSARLGGIAETVGGEKGLYLGAIAQAMAQVSEAKQSLEIKPGEKQLDEPPEGETKQAQEPKTELAEGTDMKALVAAVTDALQLDALSEMLAGLKGQVGTLGTEVKELQTENAALTEQVETLEGEKEALKARLTETEKTDELRLAEKELDKPRFSWFRASDAAETVIDQHTATAQKAVRSAGTGGEPPAPLTALVGMMGGDGTEQ